MPPNHTHPAIPAQLHPAINQAAYVTKPHLCPDALHSLPVQAKEEGVVTYVSNLYDTYFEGGRDHRLERVSITQLPYYDGGSTQRGCMLRGVYVCV